MNRVSPWVWVALIALCFGALVVFNREHVDDAGGIIVGVLGVAIAGLSARGHDETKTELVTLRRSLYPRREPSMHDVETLPPPSELPKP